jgi:hypothetical protein
MHHSVFRDVITVHKEGYKACQNNGGVKLEVKLILVGCMDKCHWLDGYERVVQMDSFVSLGHS